MVTFNGPSLNKCFLKCTYKTFLVFTFCNKYNRKQLCLTQLLNFYKCHRHKSCTFNSVSSIFMNDVGRNHNNKRKAVYNH